MESDPPFNYSRINVVGNSSSGKSTFARKLASVLNSPYIEMDKIFWKPQWTESSDEEFYTGLRSALQASSWVLDGNYNRTVPIKWEKVDLVIWLDYSFPRTVFQSVRRAVHRAWTQQELWEGTGNRESFRRSFFSRESIIWWVITSYEKVRKRYEYVIQDPKFSHIKFIRFKNHAEAQAFLDDLLRELDAGK